MNTSDEISLHQVLKIFTARWKYLLLLSLVFTLSALVKHKYFPSYPGTGKLIIKDVRNSQLQSIIGHVAGVEAESITPELKGEDLVVRAEALLDIHEFYIAVGLRLLEIRNQTHNSALINFFNDFKKTEKDPDYIHDVANKISTLITFNSSKADVLVVEVKTNNKELTVMLVNETLKEAQKTLTERELADLNRAENYFRVELEGVRSRLNMIENSTVRKMQKNQVFSVTAEKDESTKYISELRKNINDTQILITNNEERISELKKKIEDKIHNSSVRDTSLSKFNETSQIRQLQEENNELGLELKTHQDYLKNFETQKNGLVPFQYEIDKMNANHELEYKIYASLNDSLSRIGLQKTYVKNKIEILEMESASRVRSSPGILILLLIALTLSQLVGIFCIYTYELFRPTPSMMMFYPIQADSNDIEFDQIHNDAPFYKDNSLGPL